MARAFIGFGQVNYIGAVYTTPMKLAGLSGVVVPITIPWLIYGASSAKPNINVLVDTSTAVCRALDQIRSVYIDNLGSANPIYVFFPDTGCTVAAKANSEGWYPAYTNQKTAWVIGEGFLTGSIPNTLVLLSNIPVPTAVFTELDQSVALWQASPVITRGTSIYNSNFGIPALGDQFFISAPLSTISSLPTGMWNTPYPSGFIYVTSITVNLFNQQSASVVPNQGALSIGSTGLGGTLLQLFFSNVPLFANVPPLNLVLFSVSGLQIKLDATQTWRFSIVTGTTGSGFAQITSSFTQVP